MIAVPSREGRVEKNGIARCLSKIHETAYKAQSAQGTGDRLARHGQGARAESRGFSKVYTHCAEAGRPRPYVNQFLPGKAVIAGHCIRRAFAQPSIQHAPFIIPAVPVKSART